jgi:hypothetical protein
MVNPFDGIQRSDGFSLASGTATFESNPQTQGEPNCATGP